MCDQNKTECCGNCTEQPTLPGISITAKNEAHVDCAEAERITEAMLLLQWRIHANAVSKGWWEVPESAKVAVRTLTMMRDSARKSGNEPAAQSFQQSVDWIEKATDRNMGEAIALIHSEASEALEASRAGSPPDDKVPEFSGEEAELADIIIRVLDLAQGKNLRVIEAIIAKHRYNTTRAYKHGKKF